MQPQVVLERALRSTEAIVGAVRTDALARQTPCTQWDVRALLNHLLGQMWTFAGRLSGTEPRYSAPPGGLPDVDLVDEDPSGAYRGAAAAVLAAARDPDSYQRAGLAYGAYTTDVLIHGWDLAKGTGQEVSFDDEVVQWCLDYLRQGLTDDNRAPAFGPQQNHPAGASLTDELVAFTGRTP